MFPFQTALNTSTLSPFQLSILEQIEIVAEAGYEGIEIWVKDVEDYVASGGSLQDIRDKLAEKNIIPVNAIAFWKWADADPSERERGWEQAKRELEWLEKIGCEAVAVPPYGDVEAVPLDEMASTLSKLVHLTRTYGVEPYLEFWGRAKKLSTLSEAIHLARKSGITEPKILLDPFHMYTGGTGFAELEHLSAGEIGIVHVNDYSENALKSSIQDKHRLFPGDGVVPSTFIATTLFNTGYTGFLSLELFIEDYHNLTALEVAKKGVMKMRNAYSVQ